MSSIYSKIRLIGSLLIIVSCTSPKTEVILMGTVHSPVQNFNQDTLYNILIKIQPEVVLYEVDSSFFDTSFNFEKELKSNEYFAATRYIENYGAIIRPYDFTGRNEYRINVGSRPTDNFTHKLLDSLYREGVLNDKHQKIYKEYHHINTLLNQKAFEGVLAFNNSQTDSIAELRQLYQYKKLLTIVNEIPVFDSLTVKKPNGKDITYRDGFKLAGDFWNMRNTKMADHILHMTQEFKGKRIVVLNGFFHRYYLNKLLIPHQQTMGFKIKDLDEFY